MKIYILTLTSGIEINCKEINSDQNSILNEVYNTIGCWIQTIKYPEENITVFLKDDNKISVFFDSGRLFKKNPEDTVNVILAGYNEENDDFCDLEEKRVIQFINKYILI